MSVPKTNELMEKIVSLCKRRGFIYQSSEIYGGINGFWDYGPLGAELKRNIKDCWWRYMTQEREDVVGLDATIIMHPRIWEASGHATTFSDPMSTCKHCKKLVRSDQVWELLGEAAWTASLAEFCHGGVFNPVQLRGWGYGKGKRLAPNLSLVRSTEAMMQRLADRAQTTGSSAMPDREFYQFLATDVPPPDGALVTPCPHCGGELTEPRQFNLMFRTHVGPVADAENLAYLRPETAQAIFVQFKNVLETCRQKVPFGICQTGKAFRNEVTPRNFTFRSREFEQMELEYFIKPDEIAQAKLGPPPEDAGLAAPQPNWGWKEWHQYWVEERVKWYESIGLGRDTLELYWQKKEELAHYARACVDILYKFPFGAQELEGIAARSDFDLTQHQKFSGKSMEYFDEEAKARYVPHVIEPSAGVDRLALALICRAYTEDQIPDDQGKLETRVVMRFHPRIAPIKVGVFPLLKNRPELVQKARQVRDLLRPLMTVFYDEGGAIGRRYRRQDEAGTPFGVTIDFDTLGEKPELKDTVTLRDRDTTQQTRVKIEELAPLLLARIR